MAILALLSLLWQLLAVTDVAALQSKSFYVDSVRSQMGCTSPALSEGHTAALQTAPDQTATQKETFRLSFESVVFIHVSQQPLSPELLVEHLSLNTPSLDSYFAPVDAVPS